MYSEPISVIIKDKVYLGNRYGASDLKSLKKHKITHILNICNSVNCLYPEKFVYLHIPISDGDDNISNHIEKALEFIRNGDKVFVHCRVGKSRSATIVIAYLMNLYNWSYEESLKFVQNKRPIVDPHYRLRMILILLNNQKNYDNGILTRSKKRKLNEIS